MISTDTATSQKAPEDEDGGGQQCFVSIPNTSQPLLRVQFLVYRAQRHRFTGLYARLVAHRQETVEKHNSTALQLAASEEDTIEDLDSFSSLEYKHIGNTKT